MTSRDSSPMANLSTNRENTAPPGSKGSSGETARATKLGNTPAAPPLPLVELNTVVLELVRENEVMLQTIATLERERAVTQVRLEQADRLQAEVNALRAELGYVSADTTDNKHRAQNYKKLAEELAATLERVERELEESKSLLDAQAAEWRGGAGSGGGRGRGPAADAAAALRRMEQERAAAAASVGSALRLQRMVETSARRMFEQARGGGPKTLTAMADVDAAYEGVVGTYNKYLKSVEEKAARPAEGELANTVVRPVEQGGRDTLGLLMEVVKAYAEVRVGSGAGVRERPLSSLKTGMSGSARR